LIMICYVEDTIIDKVLFFSKSVQIPLVVRGIWTVQPPVCIIFSTI